MRSLTAALLAISVTPAVAAQSQPAAAPRSGPWRAVLQTPGGELPFGLDFQRDGDRLRVWIINGSERIEIPRVEFNGRTLVLGLDHYDAELTATVLDDGQRLEGVFKRRRGPDSWLEARVAAAHGPAPRFAPLSDPAGASAPSFAGRWQVAFGEKRTPAVAIFEQAADGTATGTFWTPAGDYGLCAGRADGPRLRLSRFEGVHALLFDATLQPDGTLSGRYWTAAGSSDVWTATRDENAHLPEAMERPAGEVRADLASLEFRTVDGRPARLSDAPFRGALLIIEVLGTWCPNCHDAAALLEELHREYGGLGLAVVGLAFELTGDFERDARLVRTYVERHKLTYPVLVAGRADKAEVAARLPFLGPPKAYPTTIFLRGDGRVLAVHSGFAGPATGAAHLELRRSFERLIEQVLREDALDQP